MQATESVHTETRRLTRCRGARTHIVPSCSVTDHGLELEPVSRMLILEASFESTDTDEAVGCSRCCTFGHATRNDALNGASCAAAGNGASRSAASSSGTTKGESGECKCQQARVVRAAAVGAEDARHPKRGKSTTIWRACGAAGLSGAGK